MITAGEILKKKRISLGRSIEKVSQDTKIQKRFIQFLEENKFEEFDSQVFITGFIKIYSSYLGLDEEKMLALYRRSNPEKEITPKKGILNTKDLKTSNFSNLLNPKNIAIAFTSLLVIGLLGYIGFQIYKFQSPPELTITSPLNESTTKEEIIILEGSTDPETQLYINNTLTETTSEGTFSKSLTLTEGNNLITVKARKNNNNIQETVKTIKITYQAPLEETVTEEEQTTNKLTLEIKDSPAWVRLDIDKENKVSQILQPGTSNEYDITSDFYLTTGKVASTLLYFNGEPVTIQTGSNSGVAELSCQIVENKLACD